MIFPFSAEKNKTTESENKFSAEKLTKNKKQLFFGRKRKIKQKIPEKCTISYVTSTSHKYSHIGFCDCDIVTPKLIKRTTHISINLL